MGDTGDMRRELLEKMGIIVTDRTDAYWKMISTINKLGIKIDYTNEHLFDMRMFYIERRRKDRVDVLKTTLVAAIVFAVVMWALYAPRF